MEINIKNKKVFIFLTLLLVIGAIGGTFAYFIGSSVFENEFHAGTFSQDIIETFKAPDDWKPGDITPKTIEVTNSGTIPVKVAVEVYQEWSSINGSCLSVWGVDSDQSRSMAILNLINEDKWTAYYQWGYDYVGEGNGNYNEIYNEENDTYEYVEAEGGEFEKYEEPYLYQTGLFVYNDVLEEGKTTPSFMESVTFNPDANNSYSSCDKYYILDDGTEAEYYYTRGGNIYGLINGTVGIIDESRVTGEKQICSNSGSYNGATYTLYFKIHTIQEEAFDDYLEEAKVNLSYDVAVESKVCIPQQGSEEQPS